MANDVWGNNEDGNLFNDSINTVSFEKNLSSPESINNNRIFDAYIGNMLDKNKVIKTITTNWRNKATNGFCQVNKNVFLQSLDINDLGFSFENIFDGGIDAIMGKKGKSALEKLNKITQGYESLINTYYVSGGSNNMFLKEKHKRDINSTRALQEAGNYLSKYATFKAWSNTTPLTFKNSLTFDFNFGQFGLYNCKEEVIKPIIALASTFAARQTTGNRFIGPTPTTPAFTTSLLSNTTKVFTETTKNNILDNGITYNYLNNNTTEESVLTERQKELVENEKSEEAATLLEEQFKEMQLNKIEKDENNYQDLSSYFNKYNYSNKTENSITKNSSVNSVTNLINKIYETFDSSVEKALSSQGESYNNRLLYLYFGRQLIGPIIVGNVEFSFNFLNLDEEGYPTEGKITFSGLSYIETTNEEVLDRTFLDSKFLKENT